jgi:hypothetical protein
MPPTKGEEAPMSFLKGYKAKMPPTKGSRVFSELMCYPRRMAGSKETW